MRRVAMEDQPNNDTLTRSTGCRHSQCSEVHSVDSQNVLSPAGGATVGKEDQLLQQMRGRILRGIGGTSGAFCLFYTSYIGLTVVQSSIVGAIGTLGMGLNFAASILGCLGLAPMLVTLLGCKRCMLLGGVAFWLWMLANFYPTTYTVWPTSILSGLAFGPLFTAQGYYFTESGKKYARLTGQTEEKVIATFFGFFFCALYMGASLGCLTTSLVLELWPVPTAATTTNTTTTMVDAVRSSAVFGPSSIHSTADDDVCGAKFCPAMLQVGGQEASMGNASDQLMVEPHSGLIPQFVFVVAVHSGIMLLSLIVMALAIDPLPSSASASKAWEAARRSGREMVHHLRQRYMLCMVPINVFAGYAQSFLLADFTAAYVACSGGPGLVGYALSLWGGGACLASIICGTLEPKTGRVPIFTTVIFTRLLVMTLLAVWIPDADHIYLIFIFTFLWSTGDGALISHLNTMYGAVFCGNSDVAFSAYRLYESVGMVLGYSVSSLLCTRVKLGIALTLCLLGLCGYYLADHLHTPPSQTEPHSDESILEENIDDKVADAQCR